MVFWGWVVIGFAVGWGVREFEQYYWERLGVWQGYPSLRKRAEREYEREGYTKKNINGVECFVRSAHDLDGE